MLFESNQGKSTPAEVGVAIAGFSSHPLDFFDMLPRAESPDCRPGERGTQFFGASLAVLRERRFVFVALARQLTP